MRALVWLKRIERQGVLRCGHRPPQPRGSDRSRQAMNPELPPTHAGPNAATVRGGFASRLKTAPSDWRAPEGAAGQPSDSGVYRT
jgi:hypothetical protein